jgi:hypothetical protein
MSDYAEAVERNLKGITHVSSGLCPGCKVCEQAYGMEPEAFKDACEDGSVCDEGGFSWRACECCDSGLGGNRYAAHGWLDGKLIHLDICEDCLFYLEYGEEPESQE